MRPTAIVAGVTPGQARASAVPVHAQEHRTLPEVRHTQTDALVAFGGQMGTPVAEIQDLDDCRSIERALADLSEKYVGLPQNYPTP